MAGEYMPRFGGTEKQYEPKRLIQLTGCRRKQRQPLQKIDRRNLNICGEVNVIR